MAEISREEFQAWMETLRDDIGEVKDHLRTLNSRTGKAEQDVAVLKDRAEQNKNAIASLQERANTHGVSAALGGGMASVVVGLAEGIRWWFSK